ncbi:hypothetical protein F8A10_07675 [Paracoccus kondratievae]|uniref:hypothetical protein n=1 Tax=Paracoccus kondratievae TaxID=135740 RepID=UPI0012665FF8|nr:hypothetical protein [Paracoccus kondratievae]QFQ87312.1 hypothetical protein F8A10_07675 [Paracoccus kondratievae]
MGAREDLLAIPDELLRTGQIGQAVLVHMDFRDAPKRWWTGFGDLHVGGHTWEGLGDLISISPISSSYQVSAEQVTFEVAATQQMLELALAAKERVRDRAVTVYLQLFDLTNGETPIGSPMALYTGTMQRMPWAASGARQRSIRVECEGLFFRRNAAPRGRWTDADQKSRYPGDKGFERLPLYSNGYETRWR